MLRQRHVRHRRPGAGASATITITATPFVRTRRVTNTAQVASRSTSTRRTTRPPRHDARARAACSTSLRPRPARLRPFAVGTNSRRTRPRPARWNPGSAQEDRHHGRDGSFRVPMLVCRHDVQGPRRSSRRPAARGARDRLPRFVPRGGHVPGCPVDRQPFQGNRSSRRRRSSERSG